MRSPTKAMYPMIVLALVCIGVPLFELATYPPYDIALGLTQTWQGGIEALAVIALLMLAQTLRRGASLIAMIVVGELYLRRHGVDVPAAIDLLYLEIIVALGALLRRFTAKRSQESADDFLKCFVLGVAAWSVAAWGLSAVGIGSVKALRILTVVLAIVSFAAKPRLLSAFVFARVVPWPTAARLAAAAIFGWMLVLFAKTGVAVGFDSLWYGLRGEYVLVGEGSAFASAGLVSAVHYFPKLYELMLIPVSALGMPSVVSGMSIMIFGVFAIACHEIARRLGVGTAAMRATIVLACVTLPVISNPAIDPKPDLLAGLFVLLTGLHTARWVSGRSVESALWALACAILATQAKLVAIPYAAVVLIVGAFLFFRSGKNVVPSRFLREACVVFALSLAVSLLITTRTILLAGMPTIGPDLLFHLWQTLGFSLKFPVGTLPWTHEQHIADIPSMAVQLLFQPQLLEHIITDWTGNIWLWALCALPFFAKSVDGASDSERRALLRLCAGLGIAGLVLEFGMSYGVRGGDGNYFISAVAPAAVLALALLSARAGNRASRIAFIACLCAFALFQAAFSFVSANWYAGTREFDLKFDRSIHTYRKMNRQILSSNGLYEIDSYLRHLHRHVRVIGCMDNDLDMRLSAGAETVQQIAYSRHDFFDSAAAFSDFLRKDRIDFLILPQPGNRDAKCFGYEVPPVHAALVAIAASPDVQAIGDTGYVMYDLSRWRDARTP